MNFKDKIEEKLFDWVLEALFNWMLAALGCVLAALGCLLRYLIRYKSKVDNLRTQLNELRGARDRLQHDVDSAKWNGMKIEDDVKRRLTESDNIIAEAEKILEDDNKGWYLSMISRYQVSKRADKAASEAKNLKDEILKFNSVGYRKSPRVGGTAISNRGYKAFKSRRPILTDVLEALKNPNITRIGVYGMGGIGKTMLVKEVIKQAVKDKLFNECLFVVVTNAPDLKKIQREIAEKLELTLDVESESVLADRLCKRLLDEKILLVMDDIWKPIDLEALGISFGDDKKGSKLLLTSRFHNVVCNGMDTQEQFEVGVLSDDEPRNLFEGIVGEFAKTPQIQPYMHQIVKECAGLPIAITTVANALKTQTKEYVWKDFLEQLKMSSPIEIEGMDEKVYRSIRLSYDFLKSEEAKSLLLLCSLHEEDYKIEVEDLLRYGVGWGLFDNLVTNTIESARCRVHTLVEGLKNSSLLLDGDDNGTVKMQDVIRDVVINIAAKERHMFTIRNDKELQTVSKGKDAVAISLPYINDNLDLPYQFECSKLEFLLLFRQKFRFRIPDSFFEGLKDLRVLKLSDRFQVLPSSLSSLENLQTLCLDGGEVENAIIIGELKNLKALSLSLSITVWLPKEIGQLTQLQLLDLRECFELRFIPPNVLSNLKRLEELYLPDKVEWEERATAMVSELDHLSHLTKLHICIKNAEILPKAMVFERLESYRIAIGSDWYRGETWETSRMLKLGISFQSDCGYKVLLGKCETLFLDNKKGVTNILYELGSKGFQRLKHLTVQFNNEIQYIFKSMGALDSVFPSLESITLWYVNNLERICYTQLPTKTFCNLRVVKVRNSCKLEFVFSSSMVGCFSHLREINIEDCKIMSAIVEIEREEEIEVNSDDNIMFPNLHSLRLWNLFKLKGFLFVVDSLVLFNRKVVFPNLEELEINGMDDMKMIWPNQLISNSFGKLRTVKIHGYSSIKSIFPTFVAKALKQLEELEIKDCTTVEEIVAKEEGIGTTTLSVFPQLTTLILSRLPELRSFYPGKHISKWPLLSYLQILDCGKLKIFGSNKSSIQETNGLAHHANLIQRPLFFIEKDKIPKLEYLSLDEGDAMNETCGGPSVEFCCNLKMLTLLGNGDRWNNFPNVDAPIARAGVSEFRRLKNILPFSSTSFHNLEYLTVRGSNVLIRLLTPSTARTLGQLQEITIAGCKRMTEIVANEGSEAEAEAENEIAFNKLKCLEFYGLLSLTAFHLGNRTIKFLSLEVVHMHNCPKLKIFCSGVLSTPKLTFIGMEGKMITKKEGDGDLDLKATMKEYWEACDQKFAEKTDASESGERDASEGGESEHEANDNLERDTTSEVGDGQRDGE